MAKENYVAVFNNVEEFGEIEADTSRMPRDYDRKRLCEKVVAKAGVQNDRSEPSRTVRVTLFRLVIEKGQLLRRNAGNFDIQPQLKRMTDEEYQLEWTELLKDIPTEFHSFIKNDCWDRGHSAGYEEVINYAREMCYNIKEPIESFRRRLTTPA